MSFITVLLQHPLIESAHQQEKARDPAQPSTPAPAWEQVRSPVPVPPYRSALVSLPKAVAGEGLHPRPAAVLACAGPSLAPALTWAPLACSLLLVHQRLWLLHPARSPQFSPGVGRGGEQGGTLDSANRRLRKKDGGGGVVGEG